MENKLFTEGWKDYELIDAGVEQKLERWGNVITIRPERQAYFKSGLPFEKWYKKAHFVFESTGKTSGRWKALKELKTDHIWNISYKNVQFQLSLTKFKHIGVFPEQRTNWDFIRDQVNPDHRVLNLFAYTGAASVVARECGAEVTHVDAVKQLISWARTNMERSGLTDIRWVHEDALKFAQRELKRGNQYDVIVMDPPAWGIGAKKEKWKIEEQLAPLIDTAHKLLHRNGTLILNTYSPRVALKDIATITQQYFNQFTLHELWMKTSTGKSMFYGHLLRAKRR